MGFGDLTIILQNCLEVEGLISAGIDFKMCFYINEDERHVYYILWQPFKLCYCVYAAAHPDAIDAFETPYGFVISFTFQNHSREGS